MLDWWLLYLAMTALTILFVYAADRSNRVRWYDLKAAAAVIGATFIVTNAAVFTHGLDNQHLFTLMDACCFIYFATAWSRVGYWWHCGLVSTYIGELYLHAASSIHHEPHEYALELNLFYLSQLCVLTAPALVAIVSRRRAVRE